MMKNVFGRVITFDGFFLSDVVLVNLMKEKPALSGEYHTGILNEIVVRIEVIHLLDDRHIRDKIRTPNLSFPVIYAILLL